MISNRLLFLIATTGLLFLSCQPTNRTKEMADSTTSKDHTVVDTPKVPGSPMSEKGIQANVFIEKAALGGMMEIDLGKLALKKARNLEVKDFGKLMVQDHSKIAASLKALSSAKGLKLPVSLSEENLQQIQKMSKMAADHFENVYMKMMVQGHKKDIELFKGAVNSTDTLVADFARKFLPVLESHREKALKVRAHLKTEADKSLVPFLP